MMGKYLEGNVGKGRRKNDKNYFREEGGKG